MPLLKQYEGLFEQNEHMHPVLVLIYEDILTFHAKALRFFSGRGEFKVKSVTSWSRQPLILPSISYFKL